MANPTWFIAKPDSPEISFFFPSHYFTTKRPSENQIPVFRQPQSFKTFNKPLFQRFQQLSVYSAETAIAHDQNLVACFGIFHDFGNKGIEVFAHMQLAA